MKKLLLLLLLSTSLLKADEHKIIYMVAAPRTLSTLFLRMMVNRGDVAVFNEPSQWARDRIYDFDLCQSWFRENAPETHKEVQRRLFEKCETSDVFVKEVSFAVYDFLLEETDFVKNPNVHFVFLVRDPHATSISFYKKLPCSIDDIDYDIGNLIAVKDLYKIFEFVKEESVNPVKVLFSEQFYNKPEESVEAFCNHFDLPFDKNHLHWTPFDENFDGIKEWNEIKYSEHLFLWHGNAIRSSGIGFPQTYKVNSLGEPTFSEIEDLKDRETMRRVYQTQYPWYQKFLDKGSHHLLDEASPMFDYDLQLTTVPGDSTKTMVCFHGMEGDHRIAHELKAQTSIEETLVSFNFPDAGIQSGTFDPHKTSFGTIDELLPALFVLKECLKNRNLKELSLYGHSAGGGAIINVLDALFSDRYDEQLQAIYVTKEDKERILNLLRKGRIILDTPLKSVSEIIDFRGSSEELEAIGENYRKNDMEPIDVLKRLKSLSMNIHLHFQVPDEVLSNRDDDLYQSLLKEGNSGGQTTVSTGHDAGHALPHPALWEAL